jgi:1-deoxy-D-xylulose-5-phosphate reductoisomerase
MGTPDMKLPIQYALSHPERWPQSSQALDLLSLGGLTFEPPRWKDFPCLGFGYEAGRRGGTLPCVMNAANEIAVDAFLRGKLHFTAIAEVIRQVMEQAGFLSEPSLSDLLSHDQIARQLARQIIGNLGSRAVSA